MVLFRTKLGKKWHEKRKSNRELKKQVMKKAFYGVKWIFMT
jgi:hypothetical protein